MPNNTNKLGGWVRLGNGTYVTEPRPRKKIQHEIMATGPPESLQHQPNAAGGTRLASSDRVEGRTDAVAVLMVFHTSPCNH